MESMTIEEIKVAVKGEISGLDKTISIRGISIDSRKVSKGDLYIPIIGEKFDGHDFIDEAMEKGAIAYLTENLDYGRKGGRQILVANTLEALHDLAIYYRRKFNIPFIAVTGSSGKTTTKDMIASVLSEKYNVLKTQGNFNNEIGLPLTLFQLEDHHEMAIIEMGMNNPGEIRKLVNMVFPDIAIITNIGLTHIENLGSRENIFKAKKEILETLEENQLALLNGDDNYLSRVKGDRFKLAFLGINGEGLDIKAESIVSSDEGLKFVIREDNKDFEEFQLNLPGVHNIYNSLFAIFLGRFYGLSHREIQSGLSGFKPSQMRMDIFENNKIKVINDSYNANPDSMRAALEVLKNSGSENRRVAILGDMLELGKWTESAHFDIGKILGELKIDALITIGEYGKFYLEGARENGLPAKNGKTFKSNKEANMYLDSFLRDGDIILVKGSRGLKMEEIAGFLKERF